MNRYLKLGMILLTLSIIVVFLPSYDSHALVAIDPLPQETNITVDLEQYDFGQVGVGYVSTTYVNLANIGEMTLTISDVYIKYAMEQVPFSVELPSSLPISIPPNSSIDIPITYSPYFFETQNNVVVVVSDDSDQPIIEVALTGTGVPASDSISSIKQYINFAVSVGILTFTGNGNSAQAHYKALLNMLTAAESAKNGCGSLQAVFKRVDGNSKQPDWVEGHAQTGLADAILNIMNDMGCK